jgi:hypothetical protein
MMAIAPIPFTLSGEGILERERHNAEGVDMTMDEFESLMLKGVRELDAPVAALGENMADSMGELEAALSRVEMEVAGTQVEIAQMNLMIARRRRVLADRAANRSAAEQSPGRPPAVPGTTG